MPRRYVPEKLSLKVRRAPKGLGLGLYAGETIKKDACIIEYIGRVLTPEEERTSRSRYLFTISKNKTIDGSIRENTARYINHSCKPNAEAILHKGRVFIFALRAIEAGEAITYDYGTEYFEEYFKEGGCKCDACLRPKKGVRI